MGSGTTIPIWLLILERKKILLGIQLWIVHKELHQNQREFKKTTFKLTDTHQRTKFYIRETKTLKVRDPKLAANTLAKLDHTLKIQVKPAAVSIKKALWANKACNDSMSKSKQKQLIKLWVKDHKFQKLHQDIP